MRRRSAGFTLIEYLVVIGIFATILAVLFLLPAIWNWLAPKFSDHAPLVAQWWINLGKKVSVIVLVSAVIFMILSTYRPPRRRRN